MTSFTLYAIVFLVASIAADTIQLEPSEGILIPAPVADSLRLARHAYGSYAPSIPFFSSAQATNSFSAPFSGPAAPIYSSYSVPSPSYQSPGTPTPSPSYTTPSPITTTPRPSNTPPTPPPIPAPPCPRNYLFSCQPSLAPVPCSSSSSGGVIPLPVAYSHHVPQYAYPVVNEMY